MIQFKVERLTKDAILPTKTYSTDAGYDLHTPINFTLHGGELKVIDIGIRVGLKDGYEAQIRSRSGMAAKCGVFVLNSPGTVDPLYRGNICVILYNTCFEPVDFTMGDRIAQMIIKRFPAVELIEGDVPIDTDRGDSGFGSTGK